MYRHGGYAHSKVISTVGFRLNGVNRGGAYDYTNHAQYTRICYILQRARSGLAMWVGFRTV